MTKRTVSAGDILPVVAASFEPVEPSPRVRARFMAALDGPARYLPFCAELAAQFELSDERMQELLGSIDQPSRWKPGTPPLEGYLNFAPGPRLAPLHGGLLRLSSGGGFPLHRHTEREVTFVLSGELEDDTGHRFSPGQTIVMAEGSVHAIVVIQAPAMLAVLSGRVEMLGT